MIIRKILISFLLTLTLAIGVNAKSDTLVIHYYRFDETYDDWNLWLWPSEPDNLASEGPEDGAYPFTSFDDFRAVATINLTETNLANSTKAGLIVRTAEWIKDIGSDRFIDLDNPNELGETHIYIVQANEDIYTDLSQVDISNKIFSADFIDDNTVEFSSTSNIESDNIVILENGEPFEISTVYDGGTTRRFDVANLNDLRSKYELVLDFGDGMPKNKSIGLSGLFGSSVFNDQFAYDGELGAIYSLSETTFRLWAPISESVSVNLYVKGHDSKVTDYQGTTGDDNPFDVYPLVQLDKGVWELTLVGDWQSFYYTYSVTNDGVTNELVDPYAKTTGVNGDRGMIIDMDSTDPEGWDSDSAPDNIQGYQDSIIYELHIRDLTTHESWNGPEEYRGKYLGLTVSGTEYNGIKTGLDHLIDLGVTTIHLIPVYDYAIVDETRLLDVSYQDVNDGIFNWGYIP